MEYYSYTNLILIHWGISSFSAERAKSLLPTVITREVKESLVVDEVEVGQFKNPKDYPEIEELCTAKT